MAAGASRLVLVAFALHALARQLSGAADGLGPLPGLAFRRLFIASAELHFAENTLALHLFLESAQGLIDVIVADVNLDDRTILLIQNDILA